MTDPESVPRHAAPVAPPASISAAAQAVLAMPLWPAAAFPALEDRDGWRAHVAQVDAGLAAFLDTIEVPGIAAEPVLIAGVPTYVATPPDWDRSSPQVFLDIHGGALVYMGGAAVARCAAISAGRSRIPSVSVDYRMPPDHPFPAGLDDCLAVYRALVDERGAGNIIVGGSSAGGNLAAALMLRARDAGLPPPAGLVLLTPEVDLTESGDSFVTLDGLDRLRSLMPINRLYAAGTPLDHPHVSPLFGDLSRGFPRSFLQTGTRDLFLSNTVRMHRGLRKAGVEAELHVWEAMLHGGFGGTPEDDEITAELRRFIADCFAQQAG